VKLLNRAAWVVRLTAAIAAGANVVGGGVGFMAVGKLPVGDHWPQAQLDWIATSFAFVVGALLGLVALLLGLWLRWALNRERARLARALLGIAAVVVVLSCLMFAAGIAMWPPD